MVNQSSSAAVIGQPLISRDDPIHINTSPRQSPPEHDDCCDRRFCCSFSCIIVWFLFAVFMLVSLIWLKMGGEYPPRFYIHKSSATILDITDHDQITANWDFGVFVQSDGENIIYDQVNVTFLQGKQVLSNTTFNPFQQFKGNPNATELRTKIGPLSMHVDQWIYVDGTAGLYNASSSFNRSCAIVYATLELRTKALYKNNRRLFFHGKDVLSMLCQDLRVTFCSPYSNITGIDCRVIEATSMERSTSWHTAAKVLAMLVGIGILYKGRRWLLGQGKGTAATYWGNLEF